MSVFFYSGIEKREKEEGVYSIKYNTKWKYNTLIPPRKAPWPGIQGGYKKIQYKQ